MNIGIQKVMMSRLISFCFVSLFVGKEVTTNISRDDCSYIFIQVGHLL